MYLRIEQPHTLAIN